LLKTAHHLTQFYLTGTGG